MKKINKTYLFITVTFLVLSLGGCADKPLKQVQSQVTPPTPEPSLETPEMATQNDHIQMCQRELDILKRIDNAHYTSRKVVFDKLMSGARLYGDVRKDLQPEARSTIDALFSYKIEKLCTDISQDVLNGLSKIGESSTR